MDHAQTVRRRHLNADAALKRAGVLAGGALLLLGIAVWAGVPELAGRWLVRMLVPLLFTIAFGAGPLLMLNLHRSLRGIRSVPIALPSPWWFAAAIPVVIAAGEIQLLASAWSNGGWGLVMFHVGAPLLIAGAGLAPVGVLAFLLRTTGSQTTWRRAAVCAAAGATLSVFAVLTIGTIVPLTAAGLAVAFRNLGAGLLRDLAFTKSTEDVAKLFFSDRGLYAIATIAVAAPIAEEFFKPLGVMILGRRVRSPAEAFLLGASCGVGFAVLENLLYEGGAGLFWGGVVFLRSIGAALHPLGAGLMALGWYGVFHRHPDAWRRLGGFYLIAMTQHWLWNMASVAMTLLIEPILSRGAFEVNVLGVATATVLLLYFVGQSAAMLAAMRYVGRLAAPVPAVAPVPPLTPVRLATPRGIAIAATASLVALMPLGAAGLQAFLISLGRR
jgi:RsiW-degrading membrane proteinase PrsW (M82 family)